MPNMASVRHGERYQFCAGAAYDIDSAAYLTQIPGHDRGLMLVSETGECSPDVAVSVLIAMLDPTLPRIRPYMTPQ